MTTNFPKTCALLLAIITLSYSLTSCDKDNPIPPAPETADTLAAPVLESANISDSSFTVKWKAIGGAEEYLYMFSGKENTIKETFIDFKGLEADTEYSVSVKAVSSAEGVTDSEWSEIIVKTLESTNEEPEPDPDPDPEPEPDPEGLTFTIEDEVITSTSISFTFVPSDQTADYSYILTDTETVEPYEDNLEEIVYALIGYSGGADILRGTESIIFETNIRPGQQYSLMLFGYDGQEITSDVFRHDVETPEGEINENITFEMYANVLDSYSIFVEIYPSDNQAYYFFNLITVEEYEYYKEDLAQYIRDVCAEVGISIDTYMKHFASIGPEYDTFDHLTPNTEYILFAVGCEPLDNDVRFFTPQLYNGDLVTPSDSSGTSR